MVGAREDGRTGRPAACCRADSRVLCEDWLAEHRARGLVPIHGFLVSSLVRRICLCVCVSLPRSVSVSSCIAHDVRGKSLGRRRRVPEKKRLSWGEEVCLVSAFLSSSDTLRFDRLKRGIASCFPRCSVYDCLLICADFPFSLLSFPLSSLLLLLLFCPCCCVCTGV